ncbi:MAG TPA: hypothetical protein VFU03_10325, partial [Gemmatimonadales bacterium]|nr:hypothetical protein [Gemmatimonadales bacterium]
MIRRFAVTVVMAAIAAWCALRWGLPLGLAVWSGLAAALCGLGALLLSRQPVGVSTASGQLGAAVLRWGYKVGRGQLPGIVLVSWLIWVALGAAVMALTIFRTQGLTPWMILAWTIDGVALLYLIGLMAIRSGRTRSALLMPLLAVLGMIGVSSVLWLKGTESARESALLVGGAPIPLLAA